MTKTKNDLAWDEIFEKYKVIKQIQATGSYSITAEQINKFREARLMTKLDHKANLPEIFQKNSLSILPTHRGKYLIGKFQTYQDLNEVRGEVVSTEFPDNIKSLDYENLSSEALALNCAFVSGILSDFSAEENLAPTVSGRMSSGQFSFFIKNFYDDGELQIAVNNSQIEIDAGYEGDNSLLIIEAKNDIPRDFLVRQLYYPYRLWQRKIDKKVRPIFFNYSNGIFYIREYEFKKTDNYNSGIVTKEKNILL